MRVFIVIALATIAATQPICYPNCGIQPRYVDFQHPWYEPIIVPRNPVPTTPPTFTAPPPYQAPAPRVMAEGCGVRVPGPDEICCGGKFYRNVQALNLACCNDQLYDYTHRSCQNGVLSGYAHGAPSNLVGNPVVQWIDFIKAKRVEKYETFTRPVTKIVTERGMLPVARHNYYKPTYKTVQDGWQVYVGPRYVAGDAQPARDNRGIQFVGAAAAAVQPQPQPVPVPQPEPVPVPAPAPYPGRYTGLYFPTMYTGNHPAGLYPGNMGTNVPAK